MGLTDLVITYLAIGAAFAMRAYFINRRHAPMQLLLAVTGELLLWLPYALIRLGRRGRLSDTAAARRNKDQDETVWDKMIENVLRSLSRSPFKKDLRKALERYVALHSALAASPERLEGEFEIFAISGHLNGRTGTQCMSRRNRAKLCDHMDRTADDIALMMTETPAIASPELRADLIRFFEDLGESRSAAKLGDPALEIPSKKYPAFPSETPSLPSTLQVLK